MTTAITHKKTEIGMMPADWSITFIGNEFDIQQGKQVSARTRAGENQKPFLRTSNLFWNRIDLSVLDKMNFTAAEELRMTIKVNDVFVCEGGDIGRTALVTTELPGIYYQNHLHRLRVKNGSTNPLYFVYWMMYCLQFTEYYNGAGNKTTIPNLSQSRLKALLFPKPEKAEQDSIADILSLIQSAIQKQEQIINTTTELKNTLTKKLFTEGLNNESLKETDIGLAPNSWNVIELHHLINQMDYGTSVKCSYEDANQLPVLRIPNIINGTIDISDLKYGKLTKNEMDRLILSFGDLLFVRTNGVKENAGRCAIFKDELNQCYYASYLIRVKLKKEILLPSFFSLYARTETGQRFLSGRASRTADGKFNINTGTIKAVLVPIPDIKEQEQIVFAIETVDDKIQHHTSKKQTLESLFNAMLYQLMTGKLRTKDTAQQVVVGELSQV